jgi:alpha-galactosidase
LFAVYVDQRFTALDLAFEGCCEEPSISGVRHVIALFKGAGFAVEQHYVAYADTALVELWLVVRNLAEAPFQVKRVDSFSLDIPQASYKLLYYTSDWGAEFKLLQQDLSRRTELGSWAGLSSKGQHPWFALERDGKHILSGSVVWSGNWVLRFDQLEKGGHRISGGLNNWSFSKTLSRDEALESPHVILVLGDSLNSVSQQYARVGRKHWYPHNALSARLPVEWNHWWPYETRTSTRTSSPRISKRQPI